MVNEEDITSERIREYISQISVRNFLHFSITESKLKKIENSFSYIKILGSTIIVTISTIGGAIIYYVLEILKKLGG